MADFSAADEDVVHVLAATLRLSAFIHAGSATAASTPCAASAARRHSSGALNRYV